MPSRVIGGDATGVRMRLVVTVDPAVTMFPLADPSEPLNGSKPVTVKGPPLMNNVYRPRESVTATSEFVVLLTTTPRRGPVASETIPVARPESMSARMINGPPPVTPGPPLPSETMTEPCREARSTKTNCSRRPGVPVIESLSTACATTNCVPAAVVGTEIFKGKLAGRTLLLKPVGS